MTIFEGSDIEAQILSLIRNAKARGLTIESLAGPSISLYGKRLGELLGYRYFVSNTKHCAVVCKQGEMRALGTTV